MSPHPHPHQPDPTDDRSETDHDPELVEACPDCDTAGSIISRSPRSGGDGCRRGDPEAACRCTDCGATFDEPVERPPEHPPGKPSGLAGELARIGEDEDLMTDGGEPVPEGYRPDPRSQSTPGGLIPVECDWCPRPLPDAGVHRVETFSPDGDMLGVDWLCADCRRYGPPDSARRERREFAERLTTNMSRLERAAWWVIGWVRS
jgi:hypothetical protein